MAPAPSEERKSKGKKQSNEGLTVDDWVERFTHHMNSLSQAEQEIVKSYWPAIHTAIELATNHDESLQQLEKLEEKKECFEYSLLIQATPHILANCPTNKNVIKWAKRRTSTRKNSWGNDLIRQRESIRVAAEGHRLSRDDEGRITDVGFSDREWMPMVSPPNPWTYDPEQMYFALEATREVEGLAENLGKTGKKRSLEYQHICALQLLGIDVVSKHGSKLGVPNDKVSGYKIQMRNESRKHLIKHYPHLETKHAVYDDQRGQKWDVKRSNFRERKALYRDTRYAEEMKPSRVRHFKVIDGRKVLISRDPSPAVRNARPEMDEAA